MVHRDTPWAAGTPCWVDLGVDDFDAAKDFYRQVFGWEFTEGTEEMGGYSVISKAGREIGGISPKQDASQPTVWTCYLATESADDTVEKIKANGGQVFMEPMDVMDVGRMAIAADPGGAVFGLWQAGTTTGFRIANEPGSPTWNENMSRDLAANTTFYGAVFGYTFDDMSSDEFKYATFNVDGQVAGGLGEITADAPEQSPAHWMNYFAVDDADETVDQIVKLGGSVMAPPSDTPYGRLAIVTDLEGANFAVIKNAPPS